jgi:hypothetical protein
MGVTINFDNDSAGALPPGWEQGVTGRGTAHWAGRTQTTTTSLAPTRSRTTYRSITRPTGDVTL